MSSPLSMDAIYTALKDYVELALQRTASGVPDVTLTVEASGGAYGEEWTGIRMSKLPIATTRRQFISGDREMAVAYQLISKQEQDPTVKTAIAYSTYLDRLTGELTMMHGERLQPDLPANVSLKRVEAIQQSTLTFGDGKYSGYVLDIRFILYIRS